MNGTPRPAVYLHIGSPKTGTTFLQGVLWKNRKRLAERGVWLPGSQPNDHFRAGFDLRGLEQDLGDPREGWDGAWDATAAQIRESDAGSVVISDERLAACTVEEVERAVGSLAPREVHVVYTLRDLTGLLPAEWQEHVKHGDRRTFETWLADVIGNRGKNWFWQVHDGAEVLRRWASSVPAERLHVLTLPPRDAPRELLWERFTSILGIDPSGLDLQVGANATLGAEGAELLRRVNEVMSPDFPVWHRVELTREVLAHRVLAPRSGKTPITLPAGWSAWVNDYTHELIGTLKNGAYPIVGDLDELLPEGAEQAAAHQPPDVAAAAADAIAGLLVHMGTMREQRLRLRARMRDLRTELDAAKGGSESSAPGSGDDPIELIKRTVVALGEHSRSVSAGLRVWRRAKAAVAGLAARRR